MARRRIILRRLAGRGGKLARPGGKRAIALRLPALRPAWHSARHRQASDSRNLITGGVLGQARRRIAGWLAYLGTVGGRVGRVGQIGGAKVRAGAQATGRTVSLVVGRWFAASLTGKVTGQGGRHRVRDGGPL